MSDDVCIISVKPDVFEWLKGVDFNSVPKLPKITIGGDFYPLRPQPFEDFSQMPEFLWIDPKARLRKGERIRMSDKAMKELKPRVRKSAIVASDYGDTLIRVRIDGTKTVQTFARVFWERE